MINFAIVVPVYNEESTLYKTIYELKRFDYPVLYVNDGSDDRTPIILQETNSDYITYTLNRGKGYAIQQGAEELIKRGYEWILVIDADRQMNLKDIPILICGAERPNIKLVIGNRMHNPIGMPLIRRLVNKFMSWLISIFIEQKVIDSQCGYRMIHKDVFNLEFESNRFEFESEMIIKVGLKDWKIINVPVTCIYHKNRQSKIHPIKDGIRFIDMFLRFI